MGIGGPSGSALNWTMPSKLPRPSCCWPAAAPSSLSKDVSCSISRLPAVDCRESAARVSTAAYWSRFKLGCRDSDREDAAGAAACDGDPSCSTSLAGDGELLVKESSEAEPEDRRSRNCAPRRGVFGESSASSPSIVRRARSHDQHCRAPAPAAQRKLRRFRERTGFYAPGGARTRDTGNTGHTRDTQVHTFYRYSTGSAHSQKETKARHPRHRTTRGDADAEKL